MANQWGTGANEGDQRPNWFKDTTTVILPVGDATTANTVVYGRPNHPAEAENLEATERGWERVVRYGTREKREVVVANGGLGTTLVAPEVVDVRWAVAHDSAAYAEADFASIVVTFSHPVIVTATPTATVTSTSTGTPTITLEHVANASPSNKLVFTDGTALTGQSTETLSIGADFLALTGGLINAYNPDTDATGTAAVLDSLATLGDDAGVRTVVA